jgi:hypothetical protein
MATKFSTLALSILIIGIATISKIPTSNCHCHDSKTTQKQKSECPFGQIRTLNSTLSLPDEIPESEELTYRQIENTNIYVELAARNNILSNSEPRAPPFA